MAKGSFLLQRSLSFPQAVDLYPLEAPALGVGAAAIVVSVQYL